MNEKLPYDVLKYTFSFLSQRDRAQCRQVCSFFNTVLRPQPFRIDNKIFTIFKKSCEIFLSMKTYDIYMTINWTEFKRKLPKQDEKTCPSFLKTLEKLSKETAPSYHSGNSGPELMFYLYSPNEKNFYLMECKKFTSNYMRAYRAEFVTNDDKRLFVDVQDSLGRDKRKNTALFFNSYSPDKYQPLGVEIKESNDQSKGLYKKVFNKKIKTSLLNSFFREESCIIPFQYGWKLGGLFQRESQYLLINYKITNLWNCDMVEVYIKNKASWEKMEIAGIAITKDNSYRDVQTISLKEESGYKKIYCPIGRQDSYISSDEIFITPTFSEDDLRFTNLGSQFDVTSLDIKPYLTELSRRTPLERPQILNQETPSGLKR